MRVINEANRELATKADVQAVKAELKADVQAVKADVQLVRADIEARLERLELRLTVKLGALIALGVGIVAALLRLK